jgi:hypothetical protein
MVDDVAEMAERHGRQLSRIAELATSLAEQLHADAMAATDPDGRARSAAAFHRIARAVRQTVALEARLLRERKALLREELAEARRREDARVSARKAKVRAGVVRLIWTEHEQDDAEALEAELDERLDEHLVLDADFPDAPIEVLIARLAADLGLTPSEVADLPAAPHAAAPGASLTDSS